MDEKTKIVIEDDHNYKWPKNLPKESKNPELKTMLQS